MSLLLLVCRVLDNGFLSINDMLLELMGQHACNHGKSHTLILPCLNINYWHSQAQTVHLLLPSIGVHLKHLAILFQMSVTCVF